MAALAEKEYLLLQQFCHTPCRSCLCLHPQLQLLFLLLLITCSASPVIAPFFGKFVCVCACLFIAVRAACSQNFLANFQALKQLLIAFSSYSSLPTIHQLSLWRPSNHLLRALPVFLPSFLPMATYSFGWHYAPFEFLKFWQICA